MSGSSDGYKFWNNLSVRMNCCLVYFLIVLFRRDILLRLSISFWILTKSLEKHCVVNLIEKRSSSQQEGSKLNENRKNNNNRHEFDKYNLNKLIRVILQQRMIKGWLFVKVHKTICISINCLPFNHNQCNIYIYTWVMSLWIPEGANWKQINQKKKTDRKRSPHIYLNHTYTAGLL